MRAGLNEVVAAEGKACLKNIKVFEKKLHYVFLGDKTNGNWQQYLEAKGAAKRTAAHGSATNWLGLVSVTLKTSESPTALPTNMDLVIDCKNAAKRWCDYFEQIYRISQPFGRSRFSNQ